MIYDDGTTRIFHGGWRDFVRRLERLREVDRVIAMAEVREEMRIVDMFAREGLGAMRMAVYTLRPIRVRFVELTFRDGARVDCEVCSTDTKAPYTRARLSIPPRLEDPAIVIALVPERYLRREITAVRLKDSAEPAARPPAPRRPLPR